MPDLERSGALFGRAGEREPLGQCLLSCERSQVSIVGATARGPSRVASLPAHDGDDGSPKRAHSRTRSRTESETVASS